MASWPLSNKTIGNDHSLDADGRDRFLAEYTADLRDIARRVKEDSAATPQKAAFELLGIAEESLSAPDGRLPDAVRRFLHESLQAILDGKDADVALGIRATKGRRPNADSLVATIVASVELGIRKGLAPVEAKAATLRQVDELWDGGRSKDWLDDLLEKQSDRRQSLENLTDAELEALADFDYLKDAGIK